MSDYCLAPIPVTFGPHWVDEVMLWVAIVSALISLVVAGVAVWNGVKASNIANAAAKRDEERTDLEDTRRMRALRYEVALAMSACVVATEYWISAMLKGPREQIQEAENHANRALTTALSLINVHVESPDNRKLDKWLGEAIAQMRETLIHSPLDKGALDAITTHTLNEIHKWAQGPLLDSDLPTIFTVPVSPQGPSSVATNPGG